MESKYPRSVNVNFRKLDKASLSKILRYYNVTIPTKRGVELTQNELAVMVARVFEVQMVLENEVVDKFAEKYCHAAADAVSSNTKKRPLSSTREQLDREPAAIGEQVAAKVSKSGEDGSWILGNVLDYDAKNQCYEIQDEDDISRVMMLGFGDVRRLEDSSQSLRRGDSVLAVFPETTSFYRAVVAKNPKSSRNGGSSDGGGDVIVKFDDDEDDSGKNPARRVPSRFVIRRSDVEDIDESEDDD